MGSTNPASHDNHVLSRFTENCPGSCPAPAQGARQDAGVAAETPPITGELATRIITAHSSHSNH